MQGYKVKEKTAIVPHSAALNPQFQNSVGTLWKSVAVWTIYMFFVINFVKVTRGALGTPISSTYNTDRHNLTDLLLKVAWNTHNPTQLLYHHVFAIYQFQILWVTFSRSVVFSVYSGFLYQ